jgi:hypothetical protein
MHMTGPSSKMVRWNAETAIDITGGRQPALEPRFVLSRRHAAGAARGRIPPAKLRRLAMNAARFSGRPLLSPTLRNPVTTAVIYRFPLP